ncbi:unnamed protein product [Symbiodinium sp. CCMP2456]|nr:unnamed protein product [Symbiodinium sp. CCMP2456]
MASLFSELGPTPEPIVSSSLSAHPLAWLSCWRPSAAIGCAPGRPLRLQAAAGCVATPAAGTADSHQAAAAAAELRASTATANIVLRPYFGLGSTLALRCLGGLCHPACLNRSTKLRSAASPLHQPAHTRRYAARRNPTAHAVPAGSAPSSAATGRGDARGAASVVTVLDATPPNTPRESDISLNTPPAFPEADSCAICLDPIDPTTTGEASAVLHLKGLGRRRRPMFASGLCSTGDRGAYTAARPVHHAPRRRCEIPVILVANPTAFVKPLCVRKVASIANEIVVNVSFGNCCLMNLTSTFVKNGRSRVIEVIPVTPPWQNIPKIHICTRYPASASFDLSGVPLG